MKNYILLIFLFLATILTSYSQPRTQSDKVSITDIELERVGGTLYSGGDLWVTFTVEVDRCFGRNASMRLTPVLFNDGVEVELEPMYVVPRRAEILSERRGETIPNDIIKVRPGESQSYMAGIPYEEWMNWGGVMLRATTEHCGKEFVLPSSVALCSVHLAAEEFTPFYALVEPRKEKAKKERVQSGTLFLEFKVASSEIIIDFKDNCSELEKISSTLDRFAGDKTVKEIELWGTCSPEGSYEYNTRLAESRTQSVKNYLARKYNLTDDNFIITSTPEDWEGLAESVEASSLSNKWVILDIIRSEKSYAVKDADMRKLSNYRELLDTYYPPLRRVNYSVHYNIRDYEQCELRGVWESDPEDLSERELYTLSLCDDALFSDITMYNARRFASSAAANLNRANLALMEDDLVAAEYYLQRAASLLEISPRSATPRRVSVYYNTSGILQLKRGDMQSAALLFEKAAEMGLLQGEENLNLLNLNY